MSRYQSAEPCPARADKQTCPVRSGIASSYIELHSPRRIQVQVPSTQHAVKSNPMDSVQSRELQC